VKDNGSFLLFAVICRLGITRLVGLDVYPGTKYFLLISLLNDCHLSTDWSIFLSSG